MRVVTAFALAAALSLPAAGQMSKVPGLDCKPTLIALYEPGPNWDKRDQYTPMHLDFLRTQMKGGSFAVGGPLRDHERPGGLVILNLEDRKQADALLQQDPFVLNKVSSYSLRQWLQCHAEAPPPTK